MECKSPRLPASAFARLLLPVCLAAAGVGAQNADDLPAGIEKRSYEGWDSSIFLNATETAVQVVIVPATGGRVAHFSLDGENVLFENAATLGQTFTEGGAPLWLGGYQCDLGPESRGWPAHPQLTQGRARWKYNGDFSVHVAGPLDPRADIAIEKDFVLAPDTGDLGLTQRIRNQSGAAISCCVWDRTICKGGGFVFFPLNQKSRFHAGWSQRRSQEAGSAYDGEHPASVQTQVIEGVLVAEAVGAVTRIGADSPAGWIAYARGKLLFVKYFPWFARGRYGDGGNSVEVYFDQRAVELSPLSPEVEIAPGRDYTFPEKWVLIRLPKEVTTAAQARKLVRKIPPTPFHTPNGAVP